MKEKIPDHTMDQLKAMDELKKKIVLFCTARKSDNSTSYSHMKIHMHTQTIFILFYWRLILIPQSTAQGHLRAFHRSWKQYTTYTVYKCKTDKHNPKVSPFDITLIKNGK